MDPAALRKSWDAVEQLGDRAAAYFYAALFTLEPGLRDLFPAAMGGQRDRLLAALGHIVSHVDDGPRLAVFLQQLGRDHRRFDVQPEHYPLVGQALLHTLAKGLGPAWTPELAADWTEAYEAISAAMIDAAARSAHEPARWDAEIVSHERRCGDIAVINVRVDGGLHHHAGQSVAVESHLRPRVWRYFSPANAATSDNMLELHIRAIPGGQLSPALVYQAQVGDILHLSTPIGKRLTVPSGVGPDLLMLAGGTGLSPLKAVIDQLIRDRDNRSIVLIFGASFRHELYDLDDLTSLTHQHPRLTIHTALSADPGPETRQTVVEAALRQGQWHDRQILICGSPPMVSGTWQALVQHGYPPEQLRVEQYDGTTYAPLQAGSGVSHHD